MRDLYHFICILTLAVTFILSLPAYATLGEEFLPESTQQANPVSKIRETSRGQYTVNEYTLASGTLIREFVAPTHKVFAVIWKGPFKPDLRQLLGSYFTHYVTAASNKPYPGRHPVSLRDPHLVIHAGGHMRAFSGIVYLPDQMPAGVREDEL